MIYCRNLDPLVDSEILNDHHMKITILVYKCSYWEQFCASDITFIDVRTLRARCYNIHIHTSRLLLSTHVRMRPPPFQETNLSKPINA
jgi:hypothetical protein